MGMKLKSGADLCGFELSRFCVQNDVAIPDAPASGRKYFHTGTGMEGKYSLLGRERIFTGTSWRAAAYVDDLANLDLATNADYLALKEKVDLLSGEVDTDAIINNMKEVTAFLSGFAEDANLMSVLGGKLDKTGGKARDLAIVGSGTTYLAFESTDGISYGSIGISSAHVPKFWDGSGAYTLIHTGNANKTDVPWAASHILFPKGTSATWNVHTTDAYKGITVLNAVQAKPEGAPDHYAVGLSVSGYYGFTLASLGGGDVLLYRRSDSVTQTDWKTIAFTDSNVASASALLTDTDKYAFVNGNNVLFGYETAQNSYDTILAGRNISLRYGTTPTRGLILNSSGNVTIGPEDKAGTNYNLYVWGAAKAVGGLLTTNLAIECDENGVQAGYFSEINHVKGGSLYLQAKQGNLILSHVKGATTIRGDLSVAGYTNINNSLAVSNNIVANGTIACKGVAAEGSAPVGTVDKWAGSIVSGTKSQTYTHGLGTTDITVAIYEKNGNEWVQILTDVDIVNANSIRVTFGANTTVEHRIVVMG